VRIVCERFEIAVRHGESDILASVADGAGRGSGAFALTPRATATPVEYRQAEQARRELKQQARLGEEERVIEFRCEFSARVDLMDRKPDKGTLGVLGCRHIIRPVETCDESGALMMMLEQSGFIVQATSTNALPVVAWPAAT